MKRTTKAHAFLTILGIALSVAGLVIGALIFPNWESHHDFELNFAKNISEKYSSYYDVDTDSLQMYQSEGNSKCKYSVYYQKRGASSWTSVVQKLTFAENDEWDGENYSLKSSWWCDIRFKEQKTEGQSVKSTLCFSLGQSTD